eukprot:scaffold9354_cov108-Isochrysis_galbana.AAC.6
MRRRMPRRMPPRARHEATTRRGAAPPPPSRLPPRDSQPPDPPPRQPRAQPPRPKGAAERRGANAWCRRWMSWRGTATSRRDARAIGKTCRSRGLQAFHWLWAAGSASCRMLLAHQRAGRARMRRRRRWRPCPSRRLPGAVPAPPGSSRWRAPTRSSRVRTRTQTESRGRAD